MRFDKIILTRFGCFTDHDIDLGKPSLSGDFHIVYGPNEAGKSTLRNACLDFLYGIPSRSQYNFIHDYTVMEIGAQVTFAEGLYEAKRIKGRQETLIGVGDTPLSELTLKSALGGISREGYEHMYSLNDASLEAGGESILSSEGDLGALLFGAMSGLPDISAALTKMNIHTEKFFKMSSRKFRLADLKAELKQIDEKIKDNDIEAAAYKRLKNESRQAEDQWQAKTAEQDKKRTEHRQLQALIDVYPTWQAYIRVQSSLTPLRDAPDVPDGWAHEVNELLQKNTKAQSQAETEKQAVDRAQNEFDSLVEDETGRSLAKQVARLQGDDLEARYKTSKEIDKRRAERHRLQKSIADTLSHLGQLTDVDAQTLILPAARVGDIKSLMAKVITIDADLKSAIQEYEDAKSEVLDAQQALGAYQEPTGHLASIKLALKSAQDTPKPEDLKIIEASVSKAKAERDNAIAALTPWQGDASALSMLTFPNQDFIQKLGGRRQKILEESQQLTIDKNQLRDDLADSQSEISTLLQHVKVISDEDAVDVRQKRDDAWASHRNSLNKEPLPSTESLQQSADEFVTVLSVHDQLVSNRLSQSSESAQLRKAQLDYAKTAAQLCRLEDKQQEHSVEKKAYLSEQTKLFNRLHLPADFELSELKIWLERCVQALKDDQRLKDAQAQYQSHQDKYKMTRAAFEKVMRSCGLIVDKLNWSQLVQSGQELFDHQTKTQQQKKVFEDTLSKAKKSEAKRKRQLEQAHKTKADWSTEWSSCLIETWLGEQTPAAVAEIFNILESFVEDIKEASQLDDRIAAMAADQERYCLEVQRLAQQAGELFEKESPLSAADCLRQRVRNAEEAHKEKQKATKNLKGAQERLAIAKEAEQQVFFRFEELRQIIPANTLEELRQRIEQGLERFSLERRSTELEDDIIRNLGEESIQSSLDLLKKKVGTPEFLDSVKNQYESLTQNLKNIDHQVKELYLFWQDSERKLLIIGSDSMVAELVEQRAAMLLEIKAEAHHFMSLSAGLLLAHEALRTYRETHRSTMMKAASDAFTRITRRAFKSLSTATQEGKELLFGVRANGSTILASEMSRGTRYQLYLALRIAGHAELARHGETLPFFADDILEPFDDDRSSETFILLNEMAKHGQVVYLTHHQHLCDLAKKVTGGKVKVHELPDRAVPS